MAEFGTGKTIFILAIVVGCFAILWPKIFYPMLIESISGSPHQPIIPAEDSSHASLCCDVIFETDVNAIKVLTEMCGDILHRYNAEDPKLANIMYEQGHLPLSVVNRCRDEVFSACGLDITAVIKENVKLTKNYKQILDEIRTYNNSACLKRNFGVQLSELGTQRQMRKFNPEKTARHLRPERPPHLHPDMLHPALREKGRAIPQQKPISVASVTGLDGSVPKPSQPMPGMRPPMGGAGHVVPAPKGSGTMGIVMPLYTVGIVVFFVYTIMKVLFKKTDDRSNYTDTGMDPEIRRMMFGAAAMEECAVNAAQQAVAREEMLLREQQQQQQAQHTGNGYHAPPPAPAPAPAPETRAPGKLVVTAISGLIAEVDQQILASEAKNKLNLIKEEEGKEEIVETEDKEEIITEKQEPEIIALSDKPEINELITEEDTPVAATELEEHNGEVVKDEIIADLADAARDVEEEEEVNEETPAEDAAEVADDGHDAEIEQEEDVVCHGEEDKHATTNGHAEHPERTTTPIQQILEESGSGLVTVLGMETTARCEGGQRWHGRPPTPDTPPRSTTPLLPLYAIEQFAPPTPPTQYRWARPPTPPTPPRSTTPLFMHSAPHSYLLETSSVMQGGQHGILVSDSEIEALPAPAGEGLEMEDEEDEPPVILSGKMTLSVISLPEASQEQHGSAPASPAMPRRMFQAASAHHEEPIVVDHGDDRVKAQDEDLVNNDMESKNEFMSNGAVDDITSTNYTTASAAAAEEGEQGGLEETSADISGIDDEHAEAADIDEPAAEVEDLPQDDQEPTQAVHGQSNGLL